jgi:hypothetical protein
MSEEIYVIIKNGRLFRKDTAIRTYKTRERAKKEAQWYVERGDKCEVALLSVIKIENVGATE